MSSGYSVDTIRNFESSFKDLKLHRPIRTERYEDGTELVYEMRGVDDNAEAVVRLEIKAFVGGGFAGQVYRVEILDFVSVGGESGPGGMRKGGIYAMKILIPPSRLSLLFRNIVYWVGFQGPFQLQINPAAARAGALWQKFIRRAAGSHFDDEKAVVDIHATFVDPILGACGEISEWVEGRTWRLEVDDHLDELNRWVRNKPTDAALLGSPEYRAKRAFMRRFVELLHEMGAHEFARQYEWSTCKSQPNCLKRSETDEMPEQGLCAVDFRAGLALLPFLPMSPGDLKLILQGIRRGSLVQFDRGDLEKLERYVGERESVFADMMHLLPELKAMEQAYRESIPDITHHHVKILYSGRLWSTILKNAVTGWQTRGLLVDTAAARLQKSRFLAVLFGLLGLIPLLGRALQRSWGQPAWRRHYARLLTSAAYFKRALKGRIFEKTIGWLREERISNATAKKLTQSLWPAVVHLPLSILPAGLHHLLSDWPFARQRLDYYLLRPVRLYFNNDLREQWLRDMVAEGEEKHLLTADDSAEILSQIKEPYIQKYLKSLAVHVCTLPVTQVVSVIVAILYVIAHPEMPRGQAYAYGLGIIALFQVVPISPGSLVRGLYVVYLVLRERNFKDYNIAVFLGFFKYIGYLAFPIQMTYRYPALARFMAGHWATEAVHVVPVFGERGALLEHGIFSLFYNLPLTIRRKMRTISEIRETLPPRHWHLAVSFLAGTALVVAPDIILGDATTGLTDLKQIWYLAIAGPLAWGALITAFGGGMARWRRVIGAAACGVFIGAASAAVSGALLGLLGTETATVLVNAVWRAFVFSIVSVVGALLTEILMPVPASGRVGRDRTPERYPVG
jgi:hypothetical protein